MARQLYVKVENGVIVARGMKDNPAVATGSDGRPVWRKTVSASQPGHDLVTHEAPVRTQGFNIGDTVTVAAETVTETWADPVERNLADVKADLKKRIKADAHAKIVAVVPEWKQRNLTARATQLLRKGEANWTQAERDAWTAGNAIWVQVKAIRDASDVGEAAVDAAESVAEAKAAYTGMEWPA